MITQSTIVAFHIGRGGRFHNPGHLSFYGENKIGNYTNYLFLSFENVLEVGKKIKGKENLQAKFEKAIEGDAEAIAFFERIGLGLGEVIYTDCNGNPVGLTHSEEQTGVGCINMDNAYDTTYTCFLKDIDESEAQAILNYDGYVDSSITDYAKELLGVENETE